MENKKFYWNEDTLNAFRFESNYMGKEDLLKSVTDFVECCCDLEDGETEEMLIEDLMKQILTN